MLHSLRDLQSAFADHLAGPERPDLVQAVAGDPSVAEGRLRLHRRHLRLSLEAALAATFPTVAALVGEAFFSRLARGFIAHVPAVDPVLSRYGEDFDRFIAVEEQPPTLPYLADVARLDWALNDAFHSPFGDRLDATDLLALPATALPALSPGLASGSALIESPYPLQAIWEASQPDATGGMVDLAGGPARLLVFRRCDDAAFVALSRGEAAFVRGLLQGATLEDAARSAVDTDQTFDLATSFRRLLELGLLAGR